MRPKSQALAANFVHCNQQFDQFVQNDGEILHQRLQLRLFDFFQRFSHFPFDIRFTDARRNLATLKVFAQIEEAIKVHIQRMHRGHGVDCDGEDGPMIVQPFCARQIDIGRDK